MLSNVSTSTSPPSHKPKPGTRRRLQHLCLDKVTYNSEPEEQELIKRGYVLHIPYKKKKGKEVDEEKTYNHAKL